MTDIYVSSKSQTIQVGSGTQEIVVNPETQAVAVISAGPVGPPGFGGGGSGGHYTHTQGAAEFVWDIVHNLGYFPAGVQCFEDPTTQLVGEVHHIDINHCTVTHGVLCSGVAYLS